MTRTELYRLWNAIELHFAEAEKSVPDSLKNDAAFKEYRHFLHHNELGLALGCFELFLDENDFENKENLRSYCHKIADLMKS